MRDPQQFGREMAEMVRGYVARAVEPLRAENESLRAENKAMLDCLREVEARAIAAERHIEALADQSEESVARLNATAKEIREKLDAMAAQETPDLSGYAKAEDVDERLKELQEKIEGIPQPADWSDEIAALHRAVESIEIPEAPDLSGYAKAEDVAEVLAKIDALPEPVDYSKDIEDLRQAVEAIEIPEPIPGPAGKDGVGIAEVKQNDDGELIVKMTTGETFNVGKVRGADGLGFDDMTVEHDGERSFAFVLTRGEREIRKEFSLPVVLDRGTWKEERTYQPGDGVTMGGSYWIAQTETSARPETSKDWRLAVKRGRDGKDGTFKMAPEGPVRIG